MHRVLLKVYPAMGVDNRGERNYGSFETFS